MLPIIIIAFVVVRLVAEIVPALAQWLQTKWQQIKQTINFRRHTGVFDNSYVDAKAFYMREFKQVPCVSLINNLDVTKAFNYIQEGNCGNVLAVYQYNWYNGRKSKQNSVKQFLSWIISQ